MDLEQNYSQSYCDNLDSFINIVATKAFFSFTPTNYDYKFILLDSWDSCSRGRGIMGGGWAMVPRLNSVPHEFGHNLGLGHAKSYPCGGDIVRANCTPGEYGNEGDLMGITPTVLNAQDYGSYAKDYLRWFNTEEVSTVGRNAGGNYTLYKSEAPALGGGPFSRKVVKIPTFSGGPVYYLQYRQAQLAGPTVEMGYPSTQIGKPTFLLDTTPDSAIGDGTDMKDGYIHDETEFRDPFNGIIIKSVARDSNFATVNISFFTPTPNAGELNVNWQRPTGYAEGVGQWKEVNWPDQRYVVDVKCSEGFGCTNTWNQWSGGCNDWPEGSCPSYTTTDDHVDIKVGDSSLGYKY
jgi:hypothetical protein